MKISHFILSLVFITYSSSPTLYRVKVPEGWSRTGQGADVTFKVLSGVFDTPPELLSLPWNYLIVLFVTALLSAIASAAGISILAHRPAVEALRSQE